MRLFFWTDIEEKKKERACYVLFFVLTAGVHLIFFSKTMSIIANIIMLYVISGCYEKARRKRLFVTLLIYGVNIGCDFLAINLLTNYSATQSYEEGISYGTVVLIMFSEIAAEKILMKNKIFVTLLVYGTNMGCDLVAVHLLTDYSITGKVGECAAYITVLLLLICDVISEKILIKNKGEDKTPHGMILAVISALCLAELLIVEQELKNRILLVLFGCCVLAVVLLIFYLYDVLISAYKKLEEQSLMEKQMLIYSHQLDVLMQSEEKVKALRHDMKNHLGELALMAGNQNNEEIRKYIQDMGEYMQNQSELVSCGNKNLDSLLNYLLGQAKKKLNHVEYEVRVPSDLCISAFDLNVILGNLTENAIEAAEQTKDKWMSVDIYYEKGMLSMEIKNSFQHELAVEKNKLLSTKEEKGHGIGLANVRKMVEKYQGFMDVSNTNQIFIVKVMLYL